MSEALRSELIKDEQVLWEGQPTTYVTFTRGDMFLIPFSILWGGFAIFWEATVFLSGAPVFFLLFGSIFVAVGLYMIFGRFIYKKLKKGRTYYAVTNKRIIAVEAGSSRHISAEYIDRIPCINKTVRSDGIGTLVFGNELFGTSMYANSGMDFFNGYSGRNVLAFYDIEDADRVEVIINSIRNNQK